MNDVNGIFTYRGVHHVMHQHGFQDIAHVVSTDLVHWYRVKDAVGGNPWKNGAAWDGSVTIMPEPIGPVILYDSPPEPSNISLARAANPADPFLIQWTKAGPLVRDRPWHLDMSGERVMFPGNVWRNGDHWNMLINVRVPNVSSHSPRAMTTARYQTNDTSFEKWELADWMFHASVGRGSDSFFPLVKSAEGSSLGREQQLPKWMLNVYLGQQFVVGSYDPVLEKFTPDADGNPHTVEYGGTKEGSATWFASGPSTNNRTVTIGWLSGLGGGNQSQLSCVRELTWSPQESSLLSNPIEEYTTLRNSTLASVRALSLAGNHTVVSGGAGSSDLEAEFTISAKAVSFGVHAFLDAFGRAAATIRITMEEESAKGTRPRAGWVNASTDGGPTYGGPFLLPRGERQVHLRALLDRTSVETFVAGGRAVVTVVTREPSRRRAFGLGLFAEAGVQATATVYGMGCGWLDSLPTPPY
eukprot:SAG31_NODE_5024_length_2798_cov_8.965543_1_plen_470_part_00